VSVYVSGGGRCSISVMPSQVVTLAETSKLGAEGRVYTESKTHNDRFGNRYFENMNAEEEVPGVFIKTLWTSLIVRLVKQVVNDGWTLPKCED